MKQNTEQPMEQRTEKSMDQTENQPMRQNKKETPKKTRSPRLRDGIRCSVLLLALVLAVLANVRGRISSSRFQAEQEKAQRARYQEEVARCKVQIGEEATRYEAENRRLYNEFMTYLDSEGSRGFDAARAEVPRLAGQYNRFGKASALVRKIAFDSLKKTDSTGEMIRKDLAEPLSRPCIEASAAVCARYNRMINAMEANRRASAAALSQTLETLGDTAPMELPLKRFQQRVGDVEARIRDLGVEQALTTLSVGLEAVFIRSTVRAMANIAVRTSAKVAGKAAVSAALPLADGPLPIGDIIAVVGFAWTAWDVCRLARVLPRELRASMTQMIDTLQQDTLVQARTRAESALDAYTRAGSELRTAALSTIVQ